MSVDECEAHKAELEKLINLLDRVKTPQARQVIASRFQQILAEIIVQIDQGAA